MNDRINMLIQNTIKLSMDTKPDVFVATEQYDYHELLECQGIPQRINKYLGNDWDGCNNESTFLRDHPRKMINDVVSNIDELASKFVGTVHERLFTSSQPMLRELDDL